MSGTRAVPVLVAPEKIRSVVDALAGAVPPTQLPPVLQLTFPPLPFQVQVPAWAVLSIAHRIMAYKNRVTREGGNAKL